MKKSPWLLIFFVGVWSGLPALESPVPGVTPTPTPSLSPVFQGLPGVPVPSALPETTPVPFGSPVPGTSPLPSGIDTPVAKPYSDSEFPPWVLKVRRAEIITVGAFPIMFIFAGMGFDYVYYFTNGMPSANMPWPAGPGTAQWATTNPQMTQTKNITLVSVSLGLGLLVAGLDWWLGLGQ